MQYIDVKSQRQVEKRASTTSKNEFGDLEPSVHIVWLFPLLAYGIFACSLVCVEINNIMLANAIYVQNWFNIVFDFGIDCLNIGIVQPLYMCFFPLSFGRVKYMHAHQYPHGTESESKPTLVSLRERDRNKKHTTNSKHKN